MICSYTDKLIKMNFQKIVDIQHKSLLEMTHIFSYSKYYILKLSIRILKFTSKYYSWKIRFTDEDNPNKFEKKNLFLMILKE